MQPLNMAPPNRLSNINDLRNLAKNMNLKFVHKMSIQPILINPKQLRASETIDSNKPLIDFNKQDEMLTDRQFEDFQPHTQERYRQLWHEVEKINNTDLIQESKTIMALTELIRSKVVLEYLTAKSRQLQTQQQIQSSYVKCHQLYEKLKDMRSEQSGMDFKRKIMLKQLRQKHKNLLSSQIYNLLPNQTEYKEILAKVDGLKGEILQINKQASENATKLHKMKKETKKAYRQYVIYLKEALKAGLDYRDRGIIWIIDELTQLSCEVTSADLPSYLDEESKRYLLDKNKSGHKHYRSIRPSNREISMQGYQSQGSNKQIQNSPTTLPLITRSNLNTQRTTKSLSFIGAGDSTKGEGVLQNERQMRKVYFNTKKCIDEIIKDRDTSLSTKIVGAYGTSHRMNHHGADLIRTEDLDFQEYQRIIASYPRNTYQTVLKALFGCTRSFIK